MEVVPENSEVYDNGERREPIRSLVSSAPSPTASSVEEASTSSINSPSKEKSMRRASRRMSRIGSTVTGDRPPRQYLVDVTTRNLESKLSAIEKTLLRHEHELRNPVWMETVRNEFDSLARLKRRVDLTEMDMNNVRETMYSSANTLEEPVHRLTSSQISAPVQVEKLDIDVGDGNDDKNERQETSIPTDSAAEGLAQAQSFTPSISSLKSTIQNEINSLRHIARRIELRKAVDDLVLPKIEKLVRSEDSHERRILQLESTDEFDKLKAEVAEQLDEVRDFVEDIEQDVQEASTELSYRLDEVERHATRFSNMVSGDGDPDGEGSYIPNMREIENRFVSKEVFDKQVSGFVKDHMSSNKEDVQKLAASMRRGHFTEAGKKMLRVLNRLYGDKCRRAFQKWIRYHNTIHSEIMKGKKKIGKRLRGTMMKFLVGPYVGLFFQHWKKCIKWHEELMAHKGIMVSIVTFWRGRLPQFIDKKAWLMRWRRNTQIESLATYARSLQIQSSTTDSLDSYTAQAARLMERMPDDDHGRLVMLGFLVQALSARINDTSNKSSEQNKILEDVATMIKEVKQENQAEFGGRLHSIENSTKSRFTVTDSRLEQVEFELVESKKRDMEKGCIIEEKIGIHDERISKLEELGLNNERKLKSALTLQGELLDRLNRVEAKQSNIAKDLSKAREVADDSYNQGNNNRKELTAQLHINNNHFDKIYLDIEEIRESLKNSDEMLGTLNVGMDKSSNRLESYMQRQGDRLADLLEYVNSHVPPAPTPMELVKLANEYENKVDKSWCEGVMSTAFPPNLSLSVARFCQRLAAHVAYTADVAVLNVMVVGPQQAPPQSDKEGPKSGKEVPRSGDLEPRDVIEVTAHMGTGSPEDDANAVREEMIQTFHEEWMTLMERNDFDKNAIGKLSSARIEARAVFHRRFLTALDLAISKHDSTVMTAQSTFGNRPAQQPGGTCVACDRPLRMRYRARPMTYIHSQQSLAEAATGQAAASEKQQRDFDKMNNTINMGTSATLMKPLNHNQETIGSTANISKRPSSATPKNLSRSRSTGNTGNANMYGRPDNQRPVSAGAMRHRNAVKTAAIGGDVYVMRGGFKMPVLREQELLRKKLVKNFPREASVDRTRQVYPEPKEVRNMADDSGTKQNTYANNFDTTFKRNDGDAFDFGVPTLDVPLPTPSQSSPTLEGLSFKSGTGARRGIAGSQRSMSPVSKVVFGDVLNDSDVDVESINQKNTADSKFVPSGFPQSN
jgi:hypothetical protein